MDKPISVRICQKHGALIKTYSFNVDDSCPICVYVNEIESEYYEDKPKSYEINDALLPDDHNCDLEGCSSLQHYTMDKPLVRENRTTQISEVETVKEQLEKAHQMIADLCTRKREWVMSIPAREDYDPDLVISNALIAAEKEIKRLNQAITATREQMVEELYKTSEQVGDKLIRIMTKSPHQSKCSHCGEVIGSPDCECGGFNKGVVATMAEFGKLIAKHSPKETTKEGTV